MRDTGIAVLAYSLIPKSKIHTGIVVRRGRVVGVKMQVRCVQCVNSDPYYVGPLNTHSPSGKSKVSLSDLFSLSALK